MTIVQAEPVQPARLATAAEEQRRVKCQLQRTSEVIAKVRDTIAQSRELIRQANEQLKRIAGDAHCIGNGAGNCVFISPMRRFHFHIADGTEVFDSLGALLTDDAAALKHAEKLGDDLARTKLTDSPAK